MAISIQTTSKKLIDSVISIIDNERESKRRSKVVSSSIDIQFKELLKDRNKVYTGYSIPKNILTILKYAFSLHFRSDVDISELRIIFADIDITDALKIEYEDKFEMMNGYLPANVDFEVLDILDYLYPWQKSAIISSGRKEFEIRGIDDIDCDFSLNIIYKKFEE
ncbi:hypothetical protein BG262_02895 [Floricoccus penangensis]|uniref:Uncharacterized protein n=1 Tax=Floricoccus penangensis TaxID=1859475 RepID=A0A9Q5NZU2_9LACT|nr:hypothetical protein [Floricoccus penangensis]OFI46762.1 hypothetical protein BG262_02895 [Floricoccus penangensis]